MIGIITSPLPEIRAAEAARIESLLVKDGSRVESGTEILTLSPSTEQIWEALRGLYLVGQANDVESVKRYLLPAPGVPDHVQRQAQETVKAIESRGK